MLLREVAERTGRLVALWQTLGFVHGEQQQHDLREAAGRGRGRQAGRRGGRGEGGRQAGGEGGREGR